LPCIAVSFPAVIADDTKDLFNTLRVNVLFTDLAVNHSVFLSQMLNPLRRNWRGVLLLVPRLRHLRKITDDIHNTW
jgi:hypothetical protein